jgi:hypothetical protein
MLAYKFTVYELDGKRPKEIYSILPNNSLLYSLHIIVNMSGKWKRTCLVDQHSFTTGNSHIYVIGIVRHIGIADNFRKLLDSETHS